MDAGSPTQTKGPASIQDTTCSFDVLKPRLEAAYESFWNGGLDKDVGVLSPADRSVTDVEVNRPILFSSFEPEGHVPFSFNLLHGMWTLTGRHWTFSVHQEMPLFRTPVFFSEHACLGFTCIYGVALLLSAAVLESRFGR